MKPLDLVVTGFGKFISNAKLATTEMNLNTTATGLNATAQTAGAGATNLMTTATQGLSAAFKANPIGLIITGITTLITLYSIFKKKSDETTEAKKRESEELDNNLAKAKENKEAWDELTKSQQKQIDTGMTEISHYESLYDELEKIVDGNGRVKKGEEDRAKFIVDTLNDALGTEIKMTGNVIKNNDKLKDSIQKVIDKKKAQIILDSQKTLFEEAMNGQREATEKRVEAEQQLIDKENERNKLEAQLAEADEKYTEARGRNARAKYGAEKASIKLKIEALDEETKKIQETYDTQLDLEKQYDYYKGV